MKNFMYIVSLMVVIAMVACGGSGGGGGNPTPAPQAIGYSGTWAFTGNLIVDSCGIVPLSGLPTSVGTNNYITQYDSTNVTLVSGTTTLTGVMNTSDGFDVYSKSTTDANGCVTVTGYHYESASDGNAGASVAIWSTCSGLQCEVAYSGASVRTSMATAIESKVEPDNALSFIMGQVAQKTFDKTR